MYQSWANANGIRKSSDPDVWAVDYTAHPLLDPEFARKRSRLLRLTRLTFRRIMSDDEAYKQELSRLYSPPGSISYQDNTLAMMATRSAGYLRETDVYLASTIDLLPAASRSAVRPTNEVTQCHDVRELMRLSFHGKSDRIRFEARRKLSLAQMLLQIEQSRVVQDGPRHLNHFENLLADGLWCHTQQVHDMSVGYHLDDDGQQINYSTRPAPGDQRWDFRSTFLQKKTPARIISLDVLYYNCRFKRSVIPIGFEVVDGTRRVAERVRWGGMKQQSSGSILSKMIRKGINHPGEIADMIGAMFIVNDNDGLNDLLEMLDAVIGTPFGWRNVTDTHMDESSGSSLNSFSSTGFKVFKGDVDVLISGQGPGQPPYRFPVEIQIFTIEGYLRTVCGSHEASHQALKLRQFLFGLVPRLFPKAVYGGQWLELELD
jgi:hypothetical protein